MKGCNQIPNVRETKNKRMNKNTNLFRIFTTLIERMLQTQEIYARHALFATWTDIHPQNKTIINSPQPVQEMYFALYAEK